MQQPSQYRDPPPYPGHTKQLYQPGTRKSFSGSETSTDVSVSSSENLSTSQRQEPQGQENEQDNVHVYSPNLDLTDPDTGYSILARLGMPQSFMGKLGQEYTCIPAPVSTCSDPHQQWISPTSHPHVSAPHELARPSLAVYQTAPNPASYAHQLWTQNAEQLHMGVGPQGVTYYTHLPPPPDYPGMSVHRPVGNPSIDAKDVSRSYELMEKSDLPVSRSQPELGRYVALQATRPEHHAYYSSGDIKITAAQEFSKLAKLEEWDHSAIATRASHMVEMLSEQNKQLREEVNLYEHKVSKLQKFELEIERVHESYESLVKSSQKRERLEGALKKRMEEETKKLKYENRQLKEQLQRFLTCRSSEQVNVNDGDLQREVAQKEADLIQAISHNKELNCNNESLDKELRYHQSRLHQQQDQISLLDTALSTAQSNVERLEDECQKKQIYMERVDQLQKALSALQSTCEKREVLQQQLQAKLERELEIYRSVESGLTGILSAESERDLATVRRICHQKDAKLLQLEGELIKWEQRFLEESAKKLSLEGETKDARLVALSHSSKETEKLIAEAKADKLKNMEELYQANRKVTELEARVKSLETQLSEKEAMIKVLQRSSMTRSSSVHTIYCSPLHSPRPSLVSHVSGQLSRDSSQSSSPSDVAFFREYGTIKHIKTNSASSVDIHRLSDEETSEEGTEKTCASDDTVLQQTLWHV